MSVPSVAVDCIGTPSMSTPSQSDMLSSLRKLWNLAFNSKWRLSSRKFVYDGPEIIAASLRYFWKRSGNFCRLKNILSHFCKNFTIICGQKDEKRLLAFIKEECHSSLEFAFWITCNEVVMEIVSEGRLVVIILKVETLLRLSCFF